MLWLIYRNILDVLYVVYFKKIVINFLIILIFVAFQPHLKCKHYILFTINFFEHGLSRVNLV